MRLRELKYDGADRPPMREQRNGCKRLKAAAGQNLGGLRIQLQCLFNRVDEHRVTGPHGITARSARTGWKPLPSPKDRFFETFVLDDDEMITLHDGYKPAGGAERGACALERQRGDALDVDGARKVRGQPLKTLEIGERVAQLQL